MEEFAELIKSEKPVFVEFFATWCPHCQKMMPIIENLKRKAKDSLIVRQYDIDQAENRRLIEYYQVQAIPLMMVFKAGEQLWRQNGEMSEQQLFQTIQRVL